MAKTKMPSHYTDGLTRKFQCNGPVSWGEAFRAIAARGGYTSEGAGIRAALCYAVQNAHLINAAVELADGRKRAVDFVEDGHAVKLDTKAPKAKAPKAKAPKAKAPKAKAPKAKAKTA